MKVRESISYCVCSNRPKFLRILIEDLIAKTTSQYEILVWLNFSDVETDNFINELVARGAPIRVIGKTPENIGMVGYKALFSASRCDMIVQMDDDVLCVSKRIAETACEIFNRHENISQLVSDVIQDQYTNGNRPPMAGYKLLDVADGLYEGVIDGWFSVYRKSVRHLMMEAPYQKYFFLGNWMQGRIHIAGQKGVLCTRLKVLHGAGPYYAKYFGYLDSDIRKYREAKIDGIADGFEKMTFAASFNDEFRPVYLKARSDLDIFS